MTLPRPMSDAHADAEIARMDALVRAVGQRFHKGPALAQDHATPVDWNNPLDELIAREEEAQRDAALAAMEFLLTEGAELPLWFRERVQIMVFEQFQQYENALLEWIFASGPHPLQVLRRLFAYTKMKRASLLWNMGFRSLGALLHESHENMRLLTKSLFGNLPAAWKKGTMACQRMATSAQGNNNRQGGKKMRGEG